MILRDVISAGLYEVILAVCAFGIIGCSIIGCRALLRRRRS